MSLENSFCNNVLNSNECHYSKQYNDPSDVGETSEAKFYRLDRIVFAEPLSLTSVGKSRSCESREDCEEMELLDNITVRKKRSGKRKKLFVQLHDKSNLTCSLQNCNKTFVSAVLLKAHIRKVHYSEKKFTCEVCGACFSAQYLLRRHSAVHGEKKVQCPVCKKMLSLRTNLALHLRSHADTRQHACQTCGKRFLRKTTLTTHTRVHRE